MASSGVIDELADGPADGAEVPGDVPWSAVDGPAEPSDGPDWMPPATPEDEGDTGAAPEPADLRDEPISPPRGGSPAPFGAPPAASGGLPAGALSFPGGGSPAAVDGAASSAGPADPARSVGVLTEQPTIEDSLVVIPDLPDAGVEPRQGWTCLGEATGLPARMTPAALASWRDAWWVAGSSPSEAGRPLAGLWTSRDGVSWSEVAQFGRGLLRGLIGDETGLVAWGTRLDGDSEVLWVRRTGDGTTFESLADGAFGDPTEAPDAAAVHHRLVFLASSDGETHALAIGNPRGQWVSIAVPVRVEALASTGSALFALGRDTDGGATLLRSDSGMRWQRVPARGLGVVDEGSPLMLVAGVDQLVALGTGRSGISWSADAGESWAPADVPSGTIEVIRVDGGVFSALSVGDDGVLTMWSSRDGAAWHVGAAVPEGAAPATVAVDGRTAIALGVGDRESAATAWRCGCDPTPTY